MHVYDHVYRNVALEECVCERDLCRAREMGVKKNESEAVKTGFVQYTERDSPIHTHAHSENSS